MNLPSRKFQIGVALVAVVSLCFAVGCGSGDNSSTNANKKDLGTLQPGVIKVAIQPYMPYTGRTSDGKLEGMDGDILNAAAAELGQEIQLSVTDFAGALAAVQSGRADVTIGSIGWTEERTEQGVFTDPVYYAPASMLVRQGTQLSTVKEMEGKQLGGQTGSLYLPAMKAVPRAKLHVYRSADAVVMDVANGRLDGFASDAMIPAYIAKTNPGLDLAGVPIAPPTKAELKEHPAYSDFLPYQVGFYVSDQAEALEEALSKVVRQFYICGKLKKIVEEFGGDSEALLTPQPLFGEQRHGVDRPADWEPPTIEDLDTSQDCGV